MTITFRAKGESPGADSDSCVIVKPVGLTEGDLMVAQVVARNATTLGVFTAPGGWTSIRQDHQNDKLASALFWKIASAADVSASDFTFTATDGLSNRGAITAWYDGDGAISVDADNGQGNTSQTVTSPAITPSVANCLILLYCGIGGNLTVSAYAIATDNPASWTERYDLPTDLAGDLGLSVASAARPETTSTGNGTATAESPVDNTGQLVALSPPLVSISKRGWWSK